jgi:hypothetical protein
VHDKRSIRVQLSDKGKQLNDLVTSMFNKHEEMIKGTSLTNEKLTDLNGIMRLIERFWASQTNYQV